MNGKTAEKIYIPLLINDGMEIAIGTNSHPGACVFFEMKGAAEKYLERVKRENAAVKDCDTKVLSYSRDND